LYLRLVDPAVSFSLGGVNLHCVLSCRDLGVTVFSDLSPSVHIHDIVAKAHHDPTLFTVASSSEMLVY